MFAYVLIPGRSGKYNKMATLKEKHNPSFILFPCPSDRTAWRQFGLPVVLVMPHVRDNDGRRIPSSEILYDNGIAGVRIYVADAGSSKAPVAGHDHRGIFIPDAELYSRDISIEELIKRRVQIPSSITDILSITTRTGVTDVVEYLQHADYFDLSDVKLDIEQLPHGRYTIVYEARYLDRRVSDTGRLICINEDNPITTRSAFAMNHPGDVLLQVVESTPSIYLNTTRRSQDTTVAFYRPFTEPLQDIHDEQAFLEKANWIYNVSPAHVPYLGFLLGWELPYFPKSVDSLRKAILRNTVRLQKLKGTKRAVRELFDLFGFIVDISNVWWTPDGAKLVGPGEDVEHPITLSPTATYEPVLLKNEYLDGEWRLTGYNTDGYGAITVPLINRPRHGEIFVESFLVQKGSTAHIALESVTSILSEDIRYFDISGGTADRKWLGVDVDTPGIIGYSRHHIGEDGIGTSTKQDDDLWGWSAFATNSKNQNITFNHLTNVLKLGFNRHIEFKDSVLYVFTAYEYDKLEVPRDMEELQSNRFDIEILSKDGEQVRPDVITFLIDLLFQIKAFHSLLRKIIYSMNLVDIYQVTDYCLGGEISQDPTLDHGRIQTPPEAIVPNVPADKCGQLDPEGMGYRKQDLEYRRTIKDGLEREFDAWKDLAPYCELNKRGQDRSSDPDQEVVEAAQGEISQFTESGGTLCDLDGNNYCYKGRVRDTLAVRDTLVTEDSWAFKFCDLHLGRGAYFTLPFDIPESTQRGMLGRLEHALEKHGPVLYYSNVDGLESDSHNTFIDPNRFQALIRPSLYIEKDNLNFPGHRLPTIGNLASDFTHDTYKLRPWDIDYRCGCPNGQTPDLHAILTENSVGEQFLEFDDTPYIVQGNGRPSDIGELGYHSATNRVTHAIYMEQANGHEAITLENVVPAIGDITVNTPLFASAKNCTGQPLTDNSSGYPAITGILNQADVDNAISFDLFPAIDNGSDELRTGLGVPDNIDDSVMYFTLSSQIMIDQSDYQYQYYKGYRLDCGCLNNHCDGRLYACTPADFIAEYGDAGPDGLEVESRIAIVDIIGAGSITLDGTISSLLTLRQSYQNGVWVVDENGTIGPTAFPSKGSFSYKDEYDIVYEINWDTIPDRRNKALSYIDFLTIIKDPRIWGKTDRKRKYIGRELHYEGTISTTRLVFTKTPDRIWLSAEGAEQVVGQFQVSYLCNSPYTDPSVYKLDNSITEQPEGVVKSGPAWASAEGDTSSSIWADPTGTIGAMTWISIFGE